MRSPEILMLLSMYVSSFLFFPCLGTVVAACRDPSSALDLLALEKIAGNEDRLDVVRMDIKDQASLDIAAEHVKTSYGVRPARG